VRLALQIALAIVGGYDDREHSVFTFDVSVFDGEDVFG
jgi:hypothetical protein